MGSIPDVALWQTRQERAPMSRTKGVITGLVAIVLIVVRTTSPPRVRSVEEAMFKCQMQSLRVAGQKRGDDPRTPSAA